MTIKFEVLLDQFAGTDHTIDITSQVKQVVLPKLELIPGQPPEWKPISIILDPNDQLKDLINTQLTLQAELCRTDEFSNSWFYVRVNMQHDGVEIKTSWVMRESFLAQTIWEHDVLRLEFSCKDVAYEVGDT